MADSTKSWRAWWNRKVDNGKCRVVRKLLNFIRWYYPELGFMGAQCRYEYRRDDRTKAQTIHREAA